MTTAPRSAFGDLLRSYRLAASLTQEVLAERAAISARAISALERGVNRAPRRETLLALADALPLGDQQREALMAAGRRPIAVASVPVSPIATPLRGSPAASPVPYPLVVRDEMCR